MGNHQPDLILSPDEKKFQEYLTRGDDFCRIELFRYAVAWYRQALQIKPDDPVARERLENCSKKIRNEVRVIYALLAVICVIVIVVMVIKVF
jgi:hypothetical protein